MHFKLKTDKNRRIHPDMDRINAYVSRWLPGTDIDFDVTRRQKRVSDPMRKYYFAAVLPPFMEKLGYEPEEEYLFHRQLKIVYFKAEPDSHGIYRDKDIPSVFGNDSELGIDIKLKFTEWVKRKAAQEGVYIPDPGEA
jgi:hypothetical protein